MMRPTTLLLLLALLVTGCATTQQPTTDHTVSGVLDLAFTDADLEQLGLSSDIGAQELEQLGLTDGTNCRADGEYANVIDDTLGQYRMCAYHLPDGTQIVIEWQRFADSEALNGSYQYSSSHYFSVEGLLDENTLGDQSRFRVNSEQDYGGQYNDPNITYYHLWFTKDLYLIHVTSKGSAEAKEPIAAIGTRILTKFA